MDTCSVFEWRTLQGTASTSRSRGYFGSSATLLGGYLFVLGGSGGLGSVFALNVTTREWFAVDLDIFDGCRLNLVLHTTFLLEDRLYIHGATLRQRNGENVNEHDLLALDPVMNEVRRKPTKGGVAQPTFRKAHSADVCEVLNIVALFGGTPIVANGSNQLWLLDLVKWTWVVPKCKGLPPSPRQRHGSCVIGTKLYIHSGQRNLGDAAYDDFYILDLYPRNAYVWQKIDLQGSANHKRAGGAMVHVGAGRILIFGGYRNHSNTNELFVVDEWFSNSAQCQQVLVDYYASSMPATASLVKGYGIPPHPRESPRMIAARDKVYVVGGSDIDAWTFYELVPDG